MMTQGFLGGFRNDILSLSRSVTGDRSGRGPFRHRATWATHTGHTCTQSPCGPSGS